jgi:RNA recognition motif-containing protein
MDKKLFVGNLDYSVGDDDLEALFAEHGTVVSAVVIRDGETGRSRGFGFVEMETNEMAQAAVGAIDGSEMEGRRIRVNHTQSKTDYQRRSDYGDRW